MTKRLSLISILAFCICFPSSVDGFRADRSDRQRVAVHDDPHLSAKAAKLAMEKGCTGDRISEDDFAVKLRAAGSCFVGGFITEAFVIPRCFSGNTECLEVSAGPVAKVVFNCDSAHSEVTCIGPHGSKNKELS